MSLFKQRARQKPLPKTLPNLALQGNRIQRYEYEEGVTNGTNKFAIPIPQHAYNTQFDVNRAILLQTLRKKYFIKARYIGNIDQEIMSIAETLCILPKASQVIKKIQKAHAKYSDKLVDKGDSYYLTTNLPRINENTAKYHVDKLIDLFYKLLKEGNNREEIASQLTRACVVVFGAVRNTKGTAFGIDSSELFDTITSAVRRNVPLELALDDSKLKSEVNAIDMILNLTHKAKQSAIDVIQSGNRNLNKYRWEQQLDGSHKYVRYNVPFNPKKHARRVYNELMNPHYMSYYMQYRLSDLPSIVDGVFENENVNITKVKQDDTKRVEDMPTMTMPKFLTKDLARDIEQKANSNYQHAINYLSNRGGVHGIAKLHRFKGNKPIRIAVQKLIISQGEYGVKPRQVHRIITDRKVFKRKRHIAGGSLMIDCSGSMGFNSYDVKEIVETLPASTIAGYVGYGNSIGDYDGDIRIIAQNGHMDTKSIHDLQEHGMNSVDMEALRYLAKQPEPRVWVSDMQVVGVADTDDRRSTTLSTDKVHEIMRFMAKNNIIPIQDIEHVKQFAKQYAKFVG